MRAALPLWDQKTELDLCHVWEHPTCPVSPHADHLFWEPVVAVEVHRLEDWMHLVHVNCNKLRQTVMWASHPQRWGEGRQTSIHTQTGRDRADCGVSKRPINPDMSRLCSDACSLLAGRWANTDNTCPKHAGCVTCQKIYASLTM